MGVKVAVIGAGSTYTPELVEGLTDLADRLPVAELSLCDIDDARLEVVGGLAQRILRRRDWPGRLQMTESRETALEGADYVVIQLRVGGQAARRLDETIPLRFGCIGQETTGPGGLAKALRTVPLVLEIAGDAVRRSAPDAWILDFTNPVGIVSQALLDRGFRAIGLCNTAIGFQRRLAAMLGVDWENLQLEHVGLNHLTWERAARVGGGDMLPDLLATRADEIADELGMPGDLLRLLGAIPSYYLRYYYMTSTVLEEERDGREPRADEVARIESQLLDLYCDPELDHKPELLEQRGGAFYSLAAARLMASLESDTGDVQVVNCRNQGALPGLPDDAVVEVPARIDRAGAHPLPQSPLAPELLGLVQAAKAYERLAVEAATSGDRAVALKALLANPLVSQYQVAAPLLDALLAANRDQLPLFFPAG
ncbi:MAG: 6-phospho-beta-glucosidase [Candidatus Dormiibacterota bacterium]